MLDIAYAYERYDFLGREFLTWLWYSIENKQDELIEKESLTLELGNRIVLENKISSAVEIVTIKGDDAGLEEGKIAMQKGAMVSELNFFLKTGDSKWQLTVKGESLNISSLKPPETGTIENKEDVEGAVLEKIYLYEKAVDFLESLFKQFVKLRVSDNWKERTVPRIIDWINKK